MPVITDGRADAALPSQDFERAKAWYKEKLGLSPSKEDPSGAWYEFAEGSGFFLFPSSGKPSGEHTQLGIEVDGFDAEVEDLRNRGVVFEEYDFPGFKTIDGVAEVDGQRGVWFKDSEGNLISVGERRS